MASITNMNKTIAEYLYGNSEQDPQNFHEDYSILMAAMEKKMGAGREIAYSEYGSNTFFYTIHPIRDVLNKREGISNWKATTNRYTCAFSLTMFSKAGGYGEKFNHEFIQPSHIRAMHYSLYRLIKHGLEY